MAVRQDGISGHSSDKYLAVLGNEHRLAVVGALAESGSSADLTDLAARVAAEVTGVSRDAVAEEELERTKIELHHNHLPKLDEAGIVEYSYEDHRAAPTAELETAQSVVEMTDAVRHDTL